MNEFARGFHKLQNPSPHPVREPSPWIARFAHLIPAGGTLLDLACGGGRHARFFLERGVTVTALDRDLAGVRDLAGRAELIEADLEIGASWPLGGRRFDAVIVTNYLFRPILPDLVGAVAPGGILLYETFALGNEAYGRPRNPDFLLNPGELIAAVAGRLQVVAYESGVEDDRKVVQRICAVATEAPIALTHLRHRIVQSP